VKKPKWLGWDSSDADDDLKKVRRQTDQRIKQQEAQKEQQDERPPLALPEIATRGSDINSVNASDRLDAIKRMIDSCGNPSDFQPHRVDRRGHRE
jgi:hypothetical protein